MAVSSSSKATPMETRNCCLALRGSQGLHSDLNDAIAASKHCRSCERCGSATWFTTSPNTCSGLVAGPCNKSTCRAAPSNSELE
eukprot:10481157-Alexandrium_andersonii.AAC.1